MTAVRRLSPIPVISSDYRYASLVTETSTPLLMLAPDGMRIWPRSISARVILRRAAPGARGGCQRVRIPWTLELCTAP